MIINKKYFAQYSIVPINFDQTEIQQYIDIAAKIWLIPILGQDLYDEIEEQVENNELSEENATLLTDGGVWQYLCYATCYEGLPFLWANVTETGITLGHSDNSDSITLKDLNYVQQHLRKQTEVLKDMLIKWLCERQDSFPLFDGKCICDCGCGCSSDSCCGGTKGKLNKPNPLMGVYSTLPKCDNIK